MAVIKTVGNLVLLDDILTEKTDGQYLDFILTDPDGVLVDTSTVVGITGSLRDPRSNISIFLDQDLITSGRIDYPEEGVIRVLFKVEDLHGYGGLEQQRRELVLTITHSITKKLVVAARFTLVCLTDI